MKTIRKPDMMLSITLVFYICLVIMPFFISGGFQMSLALENMFRVFPVNLLVYVTPAVLYFAVRKNDFGKNEKSAFLLICDTLLTTLMYSAVSLNGFTVTFSLAALIILSFLSINADDIISMAVLLPGILLFKLGTEFIFACYIPILLLLLLKTAKSKNSAEKDNNKSSFLPFAYLYISVLAVILLISGKITPGTDIPLQPVSGRTTVANLVSGIILALAGCALFLIRSINATKGSFFQTITVILFAVYPLAVIVTNLFFPIVSPASYIAIIFALIIYTVGNAQLSVTYGDKAPVLSAKIPFYPLAMTLAVLFCFFVAE